MYNKTCLIFDDHPLVCRAIKELVSKVTSINKVLVSESVKNTLSYIKSENIDLIILDINLKDCDGFDFFRRIKAHGYTGKVLFFSAEKSSVYSDKAFKMGAEGYVCKSESDVILKDAVEGILNGYTFFKLKKPIDINKEEATLSNREMTVLNFLLQGKSNKEIAEILSISSKTVSTYKRRIMDKNNVNNLVDLALVYK